MIGFGLFFKTKFGIAMQAVAGNQRASVGISVRRVFATSWAIAAVVAAVGGIVWGTLLGVDNFLALLGLQVFAVVILGGLDSIVGAIVGGIIIGILENWPARTSIPWSGWLPRHGPVRDTGPGAHDQAYGLFGRAEIERV